MNQLRYTVKLFVRAEPELGSEIARQAVVDTLEELRRSGRIEDVEVLVWGKEIRVDGPLRDTDYHRTVFEHVRAFEQWANERGARLDCGFSLHEVRSSITGETYDVLRLPSLCLAVYEDEELAGVYPCVSEGRPHTVHECVADLRQAPAPADA